MSKSFVTVLLMWGLLYVFGGHIIGLFYPWEHGIPSVEYELISAIVWFIGMGLMALWRIQTIKKV